MVDLADHTGEKVSKKMSKTEALSKLNDIKRDYMALMTGAYPWDYEYEQNELFEKWDALIPEVKKSGVTTEEIVSIKKAMFNYRRRGEEDE